MRRSIKLIYTISALLIVVSIFFGIKTKNSFKETSLDLDSNEFKNAYISIDEDEEYAGYYFNNDIKNFEELFSNSDLVVSGIIEGERQKYNGAIKTSFKVNDVIKNSSEVPNLPDKIFIFEPSYFHFDNYYVQNGYNIMQNNNEYILFLKHIEKPEGYDYKNDEAITFVPVSTYYGKFQLSNTEVPKVISTNQQLTYQDIKNQSVVTEKQNVIETYQKIQSELTEHLYKSNH